MLPGTPPARTLVTSASARLRRDRAAAFLESFPASEEIVVIAPSLDAASDLARETAARRGSAFGWHRTSLGALAASLAADALTARGTVAVSSVALEALAARVVDRAEKRGELGRLTRIADRPGLPRALASTLSELRMASVPAGSIDDPALRCLYLAYEAELTSARLADRAMVLSLAADAARRGDGFLLGRPTLFLDVPVRARLERDLVEAIAARAPSVLATVPAGDRRSLSALQTALETPTTELEVPGTTALARLSRGLFATPEKGELDESVDVFSAPGESRECVEIARRIQREALRGTPFDRMAVLLRSGASYRAHLTEAFGRAGLPVHFARGTRRPDPSGRAFLALLACAAEGLSARRFAEYLSLGELPPPDTSGSPPPAAPADDRWVAADEEMLPRALAGADAPGTGEDNDAPDEEAGHPAIGKLRTPRRWEKLLVEAAVIGGRDRWSKRLDGLVAERRKDIEELERQDPDDPSRDRALRDIAAIEALRAFALPLLEALAAFPESASWGRWIDELGALATRALRRPERILSVLSELVPMADIGPVTLQEARLALGRKLTELVVPPPTRRYGKVLVATALEARGLAFDVVFAPGLAEKVFPQKVAEDPMLRDPSRKALDSGLTINADRSDDERLALRLAVGAAIRRLVVSYPRIDVEQGRPRTPSFYALEVLRAAEGRLPGFEELAARAQIAGGTRLGWPAPEKPEDAIDEAEHDLALLSEIFERPPEQTTGKARYLLSANPHLARALRARGRRWKKTWFSVDGLIAPIPAAKEALARHQLTARSFSPTALQSFASCPYRFFLYSVHRLSPREEAAPIEELDPLQRGSLVHEVLFRFHTEARARNLVPFERHDAELRSLLDHCLRTVAAEYEETLAPAVDRVWRSGIDAINTDLIGWLDRTLEEKDWTPAMFELSFGLKERRAKDEASTTVDVPLDCGIRLRGSIDLVERKNDGTIRATDYKTGKARAKEDARIGGGEILQPIFYSLVLEKLLPGSTVRGGRLYYCTAQGEYRTVDIPLDEISRAEAVRVAEAIGEALSTAFFPAYPAEGACEYCDYLSVCGPHEERRTRDKPRKPLEKLIELRKRP
jgi:ATP-dependent helicase/nuclease subunit B